MMRRAAAAALLALLAAPLCAEDSRLQTRAWHADEVVRLESRAGVEATIDFGGAEHIENVAIGDAQLWQVAPSRRADMLFVKPLGPRAHTNLTVITDRHTYFFDLVATPKARVVYLVRFTHSGEPAPEPVAPGPALTPDETALIRGEPAALPLDPAALDRNWSRAGAAALLPGEVYSDGHSTYLAWPADHAIPAILIPDAKGREGPVNFSARGDVVVIDGVPARIVLRNGPASATLTHNPAPAPRALSEVP